MVMSKKMWDFEVLNMEGKVVVSYNRSLLSAFSLAYPQTVPFWHIPPWETGFAHSTP
jgi:hypothetical protein